LVGNNTLAVRLRSDYPMLVTVLALVSRIQVTHERVSFHSTF